VTPGWERLDVSVVPAASTNQMTSGPATCVFDRIGVDPPSPPAAEVPDAQALTVRVENFIRALGLLVSDLERQEFTVLTWASELMIQELVDLMFLAAGRPRRTVKRIYVDLPQADRDVLQAIPRRAHTRGNPRVPPRYRRRVPPAGAGSRRGRGRGVAGGFCSRH
jgi:hypothetical protein